jgi:hypothetical protein
MDTGNGAGVVLGSIASIGRAITFKNRESVTVGPNGGRTETPPNRCGGAGCRNRAAAQLRLGGFCYATPQNARRRT